MGKDADVPRHRALTKKREDMNETLAVDKVLSSWLLPLLNRSWPERLALIEEIDSKIQSDFESAEFCQSVSRKFTAKIIDRLLPGNVICKEQAFIYLNSSNPIHRQAGHLWLLIHEPTYAGFIASNQGTLPRDAERRHAARHDIDLAGTLATGGLALEAKMVDVSTTGARLQIDHPPQAGSLVFFDVPFLGRMAASVVWVAATFIGLAFVADPPTLM